jgi:hypothetical protein
MMRHITFVVSKETNQVYAGANKANGSYPQFLEKYDNDTNILVDVSSDDERFTNPVNLKYENGIIVVDEDKMAQMYADQIKQAKAGLKASCSMYQTTVFGVDNNFYAMLMHVQDMTDKPKCQAVLDATDALWQDYYVEKAKLEAGQDYSSDFSSHGTRPYSFAECRAEIQGI